MYTHTHAPLFNAQVCIDGGIARCASQVFVFSVGDVLSSAVVSVLLCQAKVNKEQLKKKNKEEEKKNTQTVNSNAVIQLKIKMCQIFIQYLTLG